MGPKRKRTPSIPFANGFVKPSEHEVREAVGSFPWSTNLSPRLKTKEGMENAQLSRKALVKYYGGDVSDRVLQLIDQERYFQEVDDHGKPFWKDLPDIKHDEDWIAVYNEESETFDQYKDSILPRRPGFRSDAQAKTVIYLLPIHGANDESMIGNTTWPDYAPKLEQLSHWIEAYYGREVKILTPAVVFPHSEPKRQREICFQLRKNHVDDINNMTSSEIVKTWNIQGRINQNGDNSKFQIHGPSFLDLIYFLKQHYGALMNKSSSSSQLYTNLDDAIAFVGVTMVDLYVADTDLFLAGYACLRTECSILSYSRYHPYLKMGDSVWHDYGYLNKCCSNPYFPADRRRCKTTQDPPSAEDMDSKSKVEFLRRAGKLMLHELGHIFGLPHCNYHSCVMNGSGHIVQDIESSPMICNICLRKVQFRLGIDIVNRYEKLLEFYDSVGMDIERKWIARRLSFINQENEQSLCNGDDT